MERLTFGRPVLIHSCAASNSCFPFWGLAQPSQGAKARRDPTHALHPGRREPGEREPREREPREPREPSMRLGIQGTRRPGPVLQVQSAPAAFAMAAFMDELCSSPAFGSQCLVGCRVCLFVCFLACLCLLYLIVHLFHAPGPGHFSSLAFL